MYTGVTPAKYFGPYTSTASLPSASANVGCFGEIGSAAPYTLYWSDGVNWVNMGVSQYGTQSQGTSATTALQPAGALNTSNALSAATQAGKDLYFTDTTIAAQKTRLGFTAANITDAGSTGISVLKSTARSDAYTALGINGSITTYQYIILGNFSVSTDIELLYPAANYTGLYALVGTAAPWTIWKSNGTSWYDTTSIASTSITVTFTLPQYIQTNGGFIYASGVGAGAGGGGGGTSTGGGGGGGGVSAYNLPIWVPAGNTNIYISIGLGGVGGSGNTSGAGSSGLVGNQSSISITAASTHYLLRLPGGLPPTGGSSTTSGGNGGGGGGYALTGGTGSSGDGGSGNPLSTAYSPSLDLGVSKITHSSGGGAGGGSSSTIGGYGGKSVGAAGVPGSGTGAGGAGATAPWGNILGIPSTTSDGTGGNGGSGGASPSAGTTGNCYGGGGGGGGAGFSGANGTHGFIIIKVPT